MVVSYNLFPYFKFKLKKSIFSKYFSQATIGKCNTSKPSMVDFVNRAKWNAWNDLSNLSQAEAEKEYISIVNELAMKKASITKN